MIDIRVLRAMAAAGATVEMILAAVEAAQNAHEDALAKRRASDVARQQKHRKRSRDVTSNRVMSRDVTLPVNGHCDPPRAYTTPPEIDPKKDLSKQSKRGARLPADWQPSDSDITIAEPLLGSQWRTEADRFRDYWHARAGSGAVKLDWSATWRNWCRTAADRKPVNGATYAKPTTADVGRDLLAKLLAADSAADDPGRGN